MSDLDPIDFKPNESAHQSDELSSPKIVDSSAFNGALIAGSYKIINEIGKGGAGTVYEVEQVFLKQRFAMKTLHGTYSDVALRRFQQEAQVASGLAHKNLVRASNFGLLPDGEPFFIMDLVAGKTLAEYLKNGPIPFGQALDLFIPLCEGLSYAHEKGLVHRDIKPGNIVLTIDENKKLVPKIIDFGIARLVQDQNPTLTKTGEVFGTPKYMSPEQCLGTKADLRSDIYSLACVLFESITGESPFVGDSALSTMMLHQTAQAPSLREASLGLEFPSRLNDCIQKALAKDPAQRFQSCLEFASELQSVKSGETSVVKTISNGSQIRRSLIVAIFLALVIPLTISLFNSRAPKTPSNPIPETTASKNTSDQTSSKDTSTAGSFPSTRPFSKIEGDLKIFDFGKPGIGEINWYQGPVTDALTELINKKEAQNRRNAVGIISIPLHDIVCFRSKWVSLQDTTFLRRFRKDDLYGLILRADKEDSFYEGNDNDVLFFASGLTNLVHLNVAHSQVSMTGLRAMHLEDFQNLRYLNISGTKVDLREFVKLPILERLRHIEISKMPNTSSVIEAAISNPNCQLRALNIDGCALDDHDLKRISKLSKLQKLHMSGNGEITDKGIEALSSLPNLELLHMRSCPKVTANSIAFFKRMVSQKLRVLLITTKGWSEADRRKLRDSLPSKCIVDQY